MKLYNSHRKYLEIRTLRWGISFHVRWKLRWYHLKIGAWKQNGLRVDSRSQQIIKRHTGPNKPKRYVNVWRFQISTWSTAFGEHNKPHVFGLMFYYGGRDTPY